MAASRLSIFLAAVGLLRTSLGLTASTLCRGTLHQGPRSDLHACLVPWHLSCGRLLCFQRLFDTPAINLLAILEKWHRCLTPLEPRYTVRDSFVANVHPLIDETDRLCCALYSHLSSNGGELSICVGRFGPQWVLYPVWKSLIMSTVSPVARFVPFAIFVCSASMFIIIVLLVDLFSSNHQRLILA